MATPTTYDIRNDADAARFRLSTTVPTRNSGGLPARDFLLTRRIRNRHGNAPRFIVLHVQEGWTPGSLEHWVAGRVWRNGVETTEPITASSTVMIQKDGSILRVIPEEHGPWTNGDVNNPTAQSAALRALGPDPNVWSLTIEAEGQPWEVMPDAQLAAIVWQCREWMDRYGIPVDNILPHSSINSRTRGQCPGDYYARVIAALGGTPVQPDGFVAPDPPPPYDGQPKTINGIVFHPYRRQVTSTGVNRRKWATTDAPFTGPMIPAGVQIDVLYWVEGQAVDGNNVWLIGESGSRIWSGGVEEAVP